jgi:hypothetical protein
MHDTAATVRSAERRVEDARRDFLSQVNAIEMRAHQLATSPLVVGGVIAVTAATAYFVLAHRGKPQPPIPTPRSGSRLLTLLKAAQMFMALSGAVAGYKAVSRDAGACHARTCKNPP